MDLILLILIISVAGPIIGSLIGVIRKPTNFLMYNMLSFAAGVMIAISFLQLLPQAIILSKPILIILGFIFGGLFMFFIDKLIPHIHPELCKQEQGRHLKKTSIYLILGIFMHNFPEGIAVGVGAISMGKTGLAIALAIAIHNIPEGICTSAPYYQCTGKKLKSFLLSSSTAIPVLVGFLIGKYFLINLSSNILGTIIAATAGIMIYISTDELIPASCSKITDHSTIFSFMLGVILVIVLGMI